MRAHVRVVALGLALLPSPMAGSANAQDIPAPVGEFEAGWVGFPDDGTVNETLVGGAARWYVSPRLSVGPELVYLKGSGHSHFVATGNLTLDLRRSSGSAPRLVPFVVAGGGVFQTRQIFFSGPFTSTEGAFTAGGGIRASVSDRVAVGVDLRIGWELHARLNALVGVRLR